MTRRSRTVALTGGVMLLALCGAAAFRPGGGERGRRLAPAASVRASALDWLRDPESWQPLSATEFLAPRCTGFVARSNKLRFDPPSWSACGPGCSVADVATPLGELGHMPALSTVDFWGRPEALLGVDYLAPGEPRRAVRRFVRLNDGSTVAALQLVHGPGSSACGFAVANMRETAAVVSIVGGADRASGRESRGIYAFVPRAGDDWAFALPALGQQQMPGGLELDLDVDHGKQVVLGNGSVSVLEDAREHAWRTLEQPSTARIGAGQGDLAVWVDEDATGHTRLRAWRPGAAVWTAVAEPPQPTCHVAVTPTRVVGLALRGSSDGCSSNLATGEAVSLWTAERPRSSESVAWTAGPTIRIADAVALRLKSWGDHAAVLMAPVLEHGAWGNAFLVVARLSTQTLWRLDASPGQAYDWDAWTLTEDALYVGEKEPTGHEAAFAIRRVVRIDLSQLARAGDPI